MNIKSSLEIIDISNPGNMVLLHGRMYGKCHLHCYDLEIKIKLLAFLNTFCISFYMYPCTGRYKILMTNYKTAVIYECWALNEDGTCISNDQLVYIMTREDTSISITVCTIWQGVGGCGSVLLVICFGILMVMTL